MEPWRRLTAGIYLGDWQRARRREYPDQALAYAITRLCEVGTVEQLMAFSAALREQLQTGLIQLSGFVGLKLRHGLVAPRHVGLSQ